MSSPNKENCKNSKELSELLNFRDYDDIEGYVYDEFIYMWELN